MFYNWFSEHTAGDNIKVQINCSYPNMNTTQQMTDAPIYANTESGKDKWTQITHHICLRIGPYVNPP